MGDPGVARGSTILRPLLRRNTSRYSGTLVRTIRRTKQRERERERERGKGRREREEGPDRKERERERERQTERGGKRDRGRLDYQKRMFTESATHMLQSS